MTLMREPVAQERPDELRQQDIQKVERPPVTPPSRIRWFEWALGIVLVGAVALAATLLLLVLVLVALVGVAFATGRLRVGKAVLATGRPGGDEP